MAKSLQDQHFDAFERVIDAWKGTPEELGACLQTATAAPYWNLPEQREAAVKARNDARKRILACDGGKELLKLEERLQQR